MPPKKKAKVQWEWKDDDGDWNSFNAADALLLEKRFQDDPVDTFCTTDFTFNKDYTTVYEINFETMTQSNKETGVSRALRRNGKATLSPVKLAKTKGADAVLQKPWQWLDDMKKWHDFNQQDALMLEEKYLELGPKASFDTKAFSFNKTHKSLYSVNFEDMTQLNNDSGTERTIRRGQPVKKKLALDGVWNWWEAETKKWKNFQGEDSHLLEAAYQGGGGIFLTKDLTFNKGYDSQYIFDFTVMTQVNSDSGTSRKIRRVVAGEECEPDGEEEDGGYASALADDFLASTTASSGSYGGLTSYEITETLSKKIIDQQQKLGAQSKRGGQSLDFGPAVSKDAHGRFCFNKMLKNEAEFSGQWVVFYHSYSSAALLYEVQAAVAAVLFRFKSRFATLPRLLYKPFEHIPNAHRMLEEFPKWPDRDHNAAFRGVGVCATSSLLAHDSEAPPKSVFLMGYSVGPLTGLLERLLKACGIPTAKVKGLAKTIVALANKHGLDVSAFGGKPCKSGRSGHMLQMFIRREICDEFVYPSFAFGVPDKKREPLSSYLKKNVKIAGQVRITANPDVFIRAVCVRMFVYSADPTFYSNREEFQEDLTAALTPILGSAAVRTKAARGIFGGELPSWWSSEDQGDAAKVSASRYGSAVAMK